MRSSYSSSSLGDTIVALATAPGRSALALVRVSGTTAAAVARRLAPSLPEPLPERTPLLADVLDESGGVVDRALVTWFAAPRSATGEDVVELSLHGSPFVVRAVLDAAGAAGARAARPGEFTERAFLAGKVDLVEAEAVRELIDARTPAAARASARRLHGELSHELESVRNALRASAVEIAGALDFAEDVGDELPRETAVRIEQAAADLDRLAAGAARGSLLSDGAKVVLVGPPNAGKSTLFNALVGSERAIVTEVAGTTRDTLHAPLDVCGVPVELVDTAGLRDTEDPVERIGVGRAREAGASADAILYVFDAAAGWNAGDDEALAELASGGADLTVIANKIDLVSGDPGGPADRRVRVVPIHGRAPGAAETLRSLLEEGLATGPPIENLSAVVGSARQRDAVRRAAQAARLARESLAAGESPEYLAARVAEALDALAELFGETTPEEILRRLFAQFCIGK